MVFSASSTQQFQHYGEPLPPGLQSWMPGPSQGQRIHVTSNGLVPHEGLSMRSRWDHETNLLMEAYMSVWDYVGKTWWRIWEHKIKDNWAQLFVTACVWMTGNRRDSRTELCFTSETNLWVHGRVMKSSRSSSNDVRIPNRLKTLGPEQ